MTTTTWKPHTTHGQLSTADKTEATDADRAPAFANITKAAAHDDVEVSASSWQDLGTPS